MKITKEFKFLMQLYSFIGIFSSLVLINQHYHTKIAIAGALINGYCLIYWNLIPEDKDESK